jgi:site-specific DNA recombinase
LRMSVDRTGEELGIERQRQDCLALVDQRGWTLACPPFTDNDKSAAGRKPRPAFLALLEKVKADELDCIVAWNLDRLLRNARDRLALSEACKEHGVIIALVRGSEMDPTTPAGRLALDILGSVAGYEIDQKSDRQRRASEQAADQGRRIGGPRPFGYEPDGMTVIEDEAAAVREAYRAILAGVPLRGIAAELNAAGMRTGQAPWKHTHLGDSSPWRADSVRRLLLNPRYAGIRAYKGEERSTAQWPALVPEETFRAAQAVLADRARWRGGGLGATQLLTGIAVCGNPDCGRHVHGGGASHKQPIYRCSSDAYSKITPKSGGRHPNRLAPPIDDYIRKIVIERLSRADARDLLIDEDRPDVPALRQEATSLRARLEGLAAEFGTQTEVTPLEYRAMTRAVRDRLAEVEDQLADAGRVSLLGDVVGVADVAEVWDSMSLDRRRAVIDELMVIRIHVVGQGVRSFRPESVTVEWKN